MIVSAANGALAAVNAERYSITVGDCKAVLAALPPQSVHVAITSPPYWRQRDYSGGGDVLGAESLWDCGRGKYAGCGKCYVCHLVEDMAAVHRVLRNDGTLWLNIGDATQDGCLLGIPWRVAAALHGNGSQWRLRSEIIWHKPDANPGMYPNRPTPGHEHVFMFVKGDNFYDTEAISEPAVYDGNRRQKRTVWTIPTGRYKGAHFATFPEALVETCIAASTSNRGVCPACGAPWVRIVDKQRFATRPGRDNKFTGKAASEVGRRDSGRHCTKVVTIGWRPSCECGPADRGATLAGAIVLDPYLGSGTTVAVAVRMGRRGIGCDVVPEYVELAHSRIAAAVKPR